MFIYGKDIPLEKTPTSTPTTDFNEQRESTHTFTYGMDIPLEDLNTERFES